MKIPFDTQGFHINKLGFLAMNLLIWDERDRISLAKFLIKGEEKKLKYLTLRNWILI